SQPIAVTPGRRRVLEGLPAPSGHTYTVFASGETPARYLPSGDTATISRAGRPCGWDGSSGCELACTGDLPQAGLSVAVPDRLKPGWTWPPKPVFTWSSAAHLDQACPFAT